jgi:hypothetical protein
MPWINFVCSSSSSMFSNHYATPAIPPKKELKTVVPNVVAILPRPLAIYAAPDCC